MYERYSILGTKNFASVSGFWLCNHIVQDSVQRNKACFHQWREMPSVHEENLDKETSGGCWIIMPSAIQKLK